MSAHPIHARDHFISFTLSRTASPGDCGRWIGSVGVSRKRANDLGMCGGGVCLLFAVGLQIVKLHVGLAGQRRNMDRRRKAARAEPFD